ncbi:Adenylate cyclase type 3 [Bagarius yarrelli]|uniref:Adenylate cyclase type 3 n=1 Tax=Bagarius yarrelli TaxID=175774 RepID=A0A556VWA1_BAGYA|nr:Adenylate cyclase type 3 [Bagarius yarrelli]
MAPHSVDKCSVKDPEDGGHSAKARDATAPPSDRFSCLPRFLRLSFSPASLENVYQMYFRRQRQETLLVLVVFAVLFNCFVIVMSAVVYSADKMATVAAAGAGLGADVLLYMFCRFRVLPDAVMRHVVPFLLWILISLHLLFYVGFNFGGFNEAGDAVGWQTFFTFSLFLTMPLPLTHILILAALTCSTHTALLAAVITLRWQGGLQSSVLIRQLVANVMLYLGAVVVGVMSYFMADRKYRTAFLEAKQSLESTMDCLHGEFELEPGNGGERCEYLMEKGIETYLVIVPKETVGGVTNGWTGGVLTNGNSAPLIATTETTGGVCSDHDTTNNAGMEKTESRYSSEKERQTGVAFSCSCIVLIFTSIMEVLIDPQLMVNYVTLAVGEVLLLILTICSLAAIFPRLFSEKLVSFSKWIDRTRWARNTWAMAAIFVLAMAEVADMPSVILLNTTSGVMLKFLGEGGCVENPQHYSFMAVLSLVATMMLVQVSHLVKLALMMLITVVTAIVDIYSWSNIYQIYDILRFINYR